MTSKPEPDERLVGAHDLALQALHEITPASTIGPAAGYLVEDDGTVSLRFENRLAGYPGWYWIVTVARVDDDEPTVLEAELMPGDGALLAPEWVPWAERLAEYRAHQAELAEQSAAASAADDPDSDAGDGSDDDDLDDETDDVEDDLDDEDDESDEIDGVVSPRLHAGDLDGVDIDELDDSADSDDDDAADSDDDADDDDSDEDESDDDDEADDSAAEGDDSEEE